MSAQAIQRLQEPPNESLAYKSALDVLDSNFPDAAHLEALDQTLAEAAASQVALRDQLLGSEKELDSLVTKTRIEALIQLDSVHEFTSQRDSVEDELAYLSHCLLSSLGPVGEDNGATLLEEIETMHRSLKELQNVRAYVAVVERVLLMSDAAVSQLRSSVSPISSASTSEYAALQNFIRDVYQTCNAVEDIGTPLHLTSILDNIREKTWADMKAILSTTLVSASEGINWPVSVGFLAASREARCKFESAFADLLTFQEIGESSQPSSQQRELLYSLQALVQPVLLRFRYHFDAERETNRLDKPEWYFSHITNVIHDHRPFMDGVVQGLLTATKFRDVNAWYQYVTLLLGILERKLKRSVPQLLDHPALLAHMIYQSLIFDSTLREMGYEFVQVEGKHEAEAEEGGISRVILDQKAWFDAWLEGEKKFADDGYLEIISASDAWAITDDSHREDGTSYESDIKATNSARRVKALVEQITDRYMPLPSFRQRTRFLIHVQVPVLDSYHSRISSSLDAFETLSSALVRAVPGALGVDAAKSDSKRLTGGVEGGQRLCKALVSARYIEHAMKIWGEEVFFLELWAEINRRASLRSKVGAHPSLPDVDDARSQDRQGAPEGTIFEELLTHYAKLSSRAEDMLFQQICGECEAALKPYFASLGDNIPSAGETDADVSSPENMFQVPGTLLPAIALLSSHLKVLRTMLSPMDTTRIYRRTAHRLAEHVLQREVLFRPGVSMMGLEKVQTRAVHAACELWAETCEVALVTTRARAEGPWSRLLAAGRILDAGRSEHERAFAVLAVEVGAAGSRAGAGIGVGVGVGVGVGPGAGGADGAEQDGQWEAAMDTLTRGLGSGGLKKEEVKSVLRLRSDRQ